MQAEVEVETEDLRIRPAKSEVQRLWADNTKAMRLFGWKPQYAGKEGLHKGLEETIAWFRASAGQAGYKASRYAI